DRGLPQKHAWHLTRSRRENPAFNYGFFRPNPPEVHREKKPVNGLVAAAALSFSANPISRASRPASIAFLNAFAMRTGSEAMAMAVLTSTASAPISIASAA